jgi:hypothetical protein
MSQAEYAAVEWVRTAFGFGSSIGPAERRS